MWGLAPAQRGAEGAILAQRGRPARRAQIRFVAAMRAPVARRWNGGPGLPIVAHRLKEIAMNPVASPRHPWKALGAVIAMLALVHGAGAHVFSHDHDVSRVSIGHAAQFHVDSDDDDCPDVDVRFGPNFPFDDDGPAADPFDHDFD